MSNVYKMGDIVKNWKIIGKTGKKSKQNNAIYLVKNLITGHYEEIVSNKFTNKFQGGQGNFAEKPIKTNSTNFAGVTSKYGKYAAQISINNINYNLGLFKTPNDASKAYQKAKLNYLINGVVPRALPHSSSLNTSGITGVYKRKNRWQAAIGVNGKFKSLGYFLTKEEAIQARKAAEEKYLNNGGNN